MNKSKAFFAGVLGGALISLTLMALYMGAVIDTNLSMILGTLYGLEPGLETWLLGLGTHLLASGVIGLLYGWLFERVWARASVWRGLLMGLVHAGLAGLAVGYLHRVHGLIPEPSSALLAEPPGFFLQNLYGIEGVAFFVGMHALFGAIMGGLYTRVSMTRRDRRALREAHAMREAYPTRDERRFESARGLGVW